MSDLHRCRCGFTVDINEPKAVDKAFHHVFWNHPERISAIISRGNQGEA